VKPWLNRIASAFRSDGFIRNVSILAGGAALGQLLALLASPLLSRLYSPDDFGTLGVYASILGVLGVAANMRYELAIPLSEDETLASNTLALSLALTAGLGLVAGVCVLLFSDELVALTGTPALADLTFLIPIGVVAIGTYTALNYWAIRQRAFGVIARTKLNQGASGALVQVGLGAIGLVPLGLLVGQVVGQTAGIATLARLAVRMPMRRVSLSGMLRAFKRYQRFPKYSLPGAVMNNASLSLPALLVAALYGPAVAGLFYFMQRVLRAPLALVGQSVSQVYYGEASHLAQTAPEALLRLHSQTAKRLLGLVIVPILVLAVAGPSIFAFVFGTEWKAAGEYAQLMAPFMLAQFVIAPLSQTFSLLEAQRLLVIVNAFKLASAVVPLLAAYYLGFSSTVAIGTYSLAVTFNYLIIYFVSRALIRQKVSAQAGVPPEVPG